MNIKNHLEFILASGSVRRQEILSLTGISYKIFKPDVKEVVAENISLHEAVRIIARKKAEWVSQRSYSPSIIISADTLVEFDKKIIGKPSTLEEAKMMLKQFSGRLHYVSTGICIKNTENNNMIEGTQTTKVYFKKITDSEIEYYIKNNNVREWTGGYAIQGTASMFIRKISGDYFNVVGLPLTLLYDMMLETGYNLHQKQWVI